MLRIEPIGGLACRGRGLRFSPCRAIRLQAKPVMIQAPSRDDSSECRIPGGTSFFLLRARDARQTRLASAGRGCSSAGGEPRRPVDLQPDWRVPAHRPIQLPLSLIAASACAGRSPDHPAYCHARFLRHTVYSSAMSRPSGECQRVH